MRRALLIIAALAVVGCGDDASTAVTSPGGGGGGAGGDGGGGSAPGRDGPWGASWSCDPGSLPQDDGTCLAAGIGPTLCGDYFASDGDQSCTPILPDATCSAGTMALPGEVSCREISSCGTGTFGDIVVDAGTVYVDQAAPPGGNGSAAMPFQTIADAIAAATDGAIVAIAGGDYPESLTIAGKGVKLWGRCAEQVRIDGGQETGIDIASDANGTELHGLAVTGGLYAVEIQADDVLIENVRMHDAGYGVRGIHLAGGALTIRSSLIESTDEYGIWLAGFDVTVRDTVVRDSGANGSGRGMQITGSSVAGRADVSIERVLIARTERRALSVDGVSLTLRDVVILDVVALSGPGTIDGAIVMAPLIGAGPTIVDAERVIIEQGGATGIAVLGASGTMSAVAVRGNDPSLSPGNEQSGDGMIIYNVSTASDPPPEPIVVRSSTFDDVRSSGVYIEGWPVRLEAVRIRDVRPFHVDGSRGTGIIANRAILFEIVPAKLTVAGSVVERVREGGILGLGADVEIRQTRVSDVSERVMGGLGRCIAFEHEPLLPATSATIASSLVERCDELGIGALGVAMAVENTEVRDIAEGFAPQGACLLAQFHPSTLQSAMLTVTDSAVEDCAGFGVLIAGADATLSGTSVVSATPYADGSFGDGITVVTAASVAPQLTSSLELNDVLIADAERAGLSLFGAPATLAGTVVLDCNTIHLNGEVEGGTDASLEASVEVTCSCVDTIETCKLLSESLEAPSPI